jgi:VIT1/CCC1 family predicted Fe2+/Mn2+ transporter
VLRAGPISMFMHGVLEYAAGAIFIAAPFFFGFDSDAATALSIIVGVLLLAIGASTDAPTGLAKTIPVEIHAVVDFALAVLLIAAPFLFGFRDESGATAFFIVVGVVHLVLAIATRFREPRPAV